MKFNKKLIFINILIIVIVLSTVEILCLQQYKFRYKALIEEQVKLYPSKEE